MPVVRLDLAYDGTDFRGWARQPHHRTVEGLLLDALAPVTGRVKLSVAGRTDAGVHAERQVVSFESDADPVRVAAAVNGKLAPEVVVTRAARVRDGFDARFSASARLYRYRLDTAVFPDPFSARYVWHRPGHLELRRMRAAASALVGRHDFASFGRATSPDGTTVRDLQRLTVARTGASFEVRVRANAFLRQMVRSIVGTLVDVGEGRIDPGTIPNILAARDRAAAGRVAPPQGLTLERVLYGAGGAERPSAPRTVRRAGGPGPF